MKLTIYRKQNILLPLLLAFVFFSSCFDNPRDNTNDPDSESYHTDFVYVDSNQNGDGSTPFNAMSDITNAISTAAANGKTGVAVAAGTYNVVSGISQIVLVEGISLYGGYSPDDWSRDPENNLTLIQDTSTSGGSTSIPNRAVQGESGVTENTVIDGFTISGSSSGAGYTTAVYLNGASPVIQNCKLNGGGTTSSYYSYGIYAASSTTTLKNNSINGGTGDYSYGIYGYTSSLIVESNTILGGTATNNAYMGTAQVTGIYCYSPPGSFIIRNNIIDAGTAIGYVAYSYGLYCTGGSTDINNTPRIQNNAIDGGQANTTEGNTYAIYLYGSFTPRIENNIILTSDPVSATSSAYGIYEYSSNADPATSRNNNVFNCYSGLYYDDDTPAAMLGIYSYNGRFREAADGTSGNLPYNPPLDSMGNYGINNNNEVLTLNGDFRYTGNLADVTFDTGGYNLSSEFITDKDGKTRTAPWSIGPYEY